MLRFAPLILTAAVAALELSCDFSQPCCWSGDDHWEIKEPGTININEFRRTFLVGRTRKTPTGNYLLRVEGDEGGTYRSCPICSDNGQVTVMYRHWQSPTSRLKLCWKSANGTVHESCRPSLASRQSHTIKEVFQVPRGQQIQFIFVSETTESSPSSVVMLDKILLSYGPCDENTSRDLHQLSHHRVVHGISLKEAAQRDDRIRLKLASLASKSDANLHMKHVSQVRPKSRSLVTTGLSVPIATRTEPAHLPHSHNAVSELIQHTASSPEAGTAVTSAKDFNPLHDLLGEQLANFLDPNYVSTADDEEEEELIEEEEMVSAPPPPPPPSQSQRPLHRVTSHQSVMPQQFVIPSHMATHLDVGSNENRAHDEIQANSMYRYQELLLPKTALTINKTPADYLRPVPVGVPAPCSAAGGCLFDRSMCGYKSPTTVPENAKFKIVQVGHSASAQSTVGPGGSSAMYFETSFSENYTVVFDALSWQIGVRLAACCEMETGLLCPFATHGVVVWHVSKMECPMDTKKIVFVCENFGQNEATCGVDNVRLHRPSDILFIEPCQKSQLNSF